MPWTTRKRKCKQADGISGSYVVLKKKSDGSTEQASCHTSEEKAKASVHARHTNEADELAAEEKPGGAKEEEAFNLMPPLPESDEKQISEVLIRQVVRIILQKEIRL